MTIVATEATLEIENTVGSALPITGLTAANPGVATSAAHGLSNGDFVRLAVTSGMVELDGQVVRVANVDTNTFELEGIDTTNFSTWESGGGSAYEVSAWYSFTPATDVDLGNASPTELDGSKLIHRSTITLYGRGGSKSGTISMHHEPHNSAVQKLRSLATSTNIAFRLTWSDGSLCCFGAKTAYSGGFTANNNSIVTGSCPITIQGEHGVAEYAS